MTCEAVIRRHKPQERLIFLEQISLKCDRTGRKIL